MEVSQRVVSTKNDQGSFIKQETIVRNFEIKKGMKIADLGCGAGYFTIPMAKMVGGTGKVYAVDVLNSSLEFVSSQAKLFGLLNIEIMRANIEILGGNDIPDKSVDLVLLANVLFQCGNPDAAIEEAKRVLVPSGKIVIIDWVPDKFFLGSSHVKCLSETDSKKIAIKNGLKIVKDIPTGKMNYGFMLRQV